ncbi:hypothetical protein ESCO_006042 [Escovopsis weberi]|uniref:Uncharacterized protein n=1 Tax=Escovopsis weberi TaxID=150374 RepID=A0A0M8N0C3_ESCWE|nr:hypothetical protein ESCO_006042 [Escovopsis weberi]
MAPRPCRPAGGMLVFGSVPPTPPGPDSGDETPSDSDESLIWPLPTWQPLVELAELLAQDPPLGLGQGGGANGLHFLGNDAGFGVLFPVGPIVAPPNTPETFPDGVSRHSDTSRERSSNFASRTSRRDESTASSSDDEATDSLSTIPEERSSALIDPDAHPEIAALAEPAEPAQQQLSSSAAAAAPVTNPSSNPGQQGEDQTSSSASSSFVVVHPEDGLPAADEPSN